MISTRHLVSVRGGTSVLNDVSISIGAGTCLAIEAVPAAAATTLLRVMAGFEEPRSGSVHLRDQSQASDALTLRRAVNYVSACTVRPGVGLTVDEFLRFLAHVQPASAAARMNTRDAAVCVGLQPSALVSALSAHERAAFALACCLAVPKDVVLIDFALDAVNPRLRDGVIAALVTARDRGAAMMVASHDRVVRDALCHRTIVLRDGHVDAPDTVHSLTPVALAERV
jgi:ABC-type multidrug transport system ATPase subunit